MNGATDWAFHTFLTSVGPEHMSLEELYMYRACGGEIPPGALNEKRRQEKKRRNPNPDAAVDLVLLRNEERARAVALVTEQVEAQIRENEARAARRSAPVAPKYEFTKQQLEAAHAALKRKAS